MTSKRQKCEQCQYPLVNCLCEAITQQPCQHQVIILQHPSESKNAKNTARLVKLAIDNSQIIQGETAEDFSELQAYLTTIEKDKILIIYPSDTAIDISQYQQHHNLSDQTMTLVFIDGSWRKAHKIMALNPWLLSYQAAKFSAPPTSRYVIRKAPRIDSLATIEAVAYTLEQLDQTDPSPLLSLFDAMIRRYLSHIPESLHHRYQ